jgi:hypothetical protein
MSTIDELPPDQRAALSVLLRQHKSYAEVATMLGIAEQAVHDRAHAALAVLAPREARGLDPASRQEIGDYLLSQQQNVGERLRTRTLLANSQAAGTWARALTAALTPLAGEALPEIPEPGSSPVAAPQQSYPLSQAASAPSTTIAAPSSRRGGAIVLAVVAVVVIVVVILLASGGNGGSSNKKNTASTSSSKTSKTTGPNAEGHFTLHAAEAHSASKGAVEILSEDGKRAFYIQAERLPETKHFFYAVWLYNSPTSALPLSKSPPVGKTHKLAGAALLPEDAGNYKEILLTRETSSRPTHPGHVVLRGPFKLG